MPGDVAINDEGELFIADTRDYRVRKVNTQGTISTIAGTGRPRYGGDRGPALQATLCCPHDVTVDRHGNLFIADYWNQSLRKVDRDGIISTLIGSRRRSNLVLGGTSIPDRGSLGLGGETKKDMAVLFPVSVAVDGIGNVFFADKGNNRVCEIDEKGVVVTIAGRGVAGFEGDGGPCQRCPPLVAACRRR